MMGWNIFSDTPDSIYSSVISSLRSPCPLSHCTMIIDATKMFHVKSNLCIMWMPITKVLTMKRPPNGAKVVRTTLLKNPR